MPPIKLPIVRVAGKVLFAMLKKDVPLRPLVLSKLVIVDVLENTYENICTFGMVTVRTAANISDKNPFSLAPLIALTIA